MTVVVEVREPNRPSRRVEVSGRVQVGREGQDLDLADPEVSRRHLQLDCLSEGGLTITDLGSTNGTLVNGSRISGPVLVRPGDVVQLGQTVLELEPATVTDASAGRVTAPPSVPPAAPTPAPPTPEAQGVPRSAAPTPPTPRPGLDELASFDAGAAVIRYRPGTTGERLFRSYAKDMARARKALAGLGSEPWGAIPQICLVDPFPDPASPRNLVTAGTVVDADRGEIWMAVSPEAPPEPPGRPLALFFGASLPAARELERLLEGYGLLVTESPSPDPALRGVDLPGLSTAQGELATAMAHSFVRYLVGRSSRETFLRLVSSARPGAVETAAQQIYGASLGELEEAWRAELVSDAAPARPGRFIRLALTYLRPHVRREVEISVYMLFSLGFTIVFPFVTRRLFDDAIPSRDLGQVLSLLIVMGLAFVVSLIANLRRSYLSAYVSGSVVRQLRSRMFAKLQSLSPTWFDRHQQGDVLSRFFSDVGQVEFGISSILRDGVFQLLSVAVAAGVLLTLDLFLGSLVILGAPLVAVVYRVMAKGAMERSSAVQEQNGALFGLASENYAAQPVVKAFGLEAREIGRFERSSDRLFRSEMKLHLFGGLFGVSVNGIVTIIRLVVLGLGAWLVIDGRLTVGGLVAFISVMGEVLAPVGTLTSLGQQLQEASGALVRIDELLDAAPDVTDLPDAPALPPLEHEIRLSRVVFSYTPERRTLDGIDCTIPAGRRVAFVGPTGAGKSSVLRLLMRSYDPDEGVVLWDGRDVRQASLASLRRQLGVVFQDTFVFNTTIRENIRLGRLDASDDEVEAAARAAELHEFVGSLPRGYDTVVGEQGSRLSGGQRQRLAIARALIRHPRVLLLDEATSALDPRTERLVCETLDRLPEKPTTIAVTHRLTSIASYDLILVVVDGRIAEQGTHDALVTRGGVYASLWAEQTGGVAPIEPPFDAVSALARVPLFRALGREELSALAERLRSQELSPGESVPEGGGTILLVRRGRAQVRRAGLAGERVVVAELGPGDSFGVSALLGDGSDAVLEPIEPTTLLVLDDAAIAAAARALPQVATALERRGGDGVAPAGGQRLSRMSVALPLRSPSLRPPVKQVAAPDAADIRRSTGSLPVVAP